MTNQLITLDWQSGIQIDPARPPLKNFQVLGQTLSGLKLLADNVRGLELNVIDQDPYVLRKTRDIQLNPPHPRLLLDQDLIILQSVSELAILPGVGEYFGV